MVKVLQVCTAWVIQHSAKGQLSGAILGKIDMLGDLEARRLKTVLSPGARVEILSGSFREGRQEEQPKSAKGPGNSASGTSLPKSLQKTFSRHATLVESGMSSQEMPPSLPRGITRGVVYTNHVGLQRLDLQL